MLVLLADDLTGAMDAGVQLAEQGVNVPVYLHCPERMPETQAMALNLETRHLSAQSAYETTYAAAKWAKKQGADQLYLKTDSGLRGNLGASLAAVSDAWNETVAFAPDYPELGRITRDGVHLIDGLPVSQSVFGRDLLNPVKEDRVEALLHQQTDLMVTDQWEGARHIWLIQAETRKALAQAAERVHACKGGHVYAGCAGFAAYLPMLCALRGAKIGRPPIFRPLLAITGSTSDVNLRQMRLAEAAGMKSLVYRDILRQKPNDAALHEKLRTALSKGGVMLEAARSRTEIHRMTQRAQDAGLTQEETGRRIAEHLGQAAAQCVQNGFQGTLCLFGGDVLSSAIRHLGLDYMTPLYQLEPGVVISEGWRNEKSLTLLTKSGSFGSPDMLAELFRVASESADASSPQIWRVKQECATRS